MARTIIDILGWAGATLYLIAYGLISAKKSGGRLLAVSGIEHCCGDVLDHQHVLPARIPIHGAEHSLGRNCDSHIRQKILEEK